MAWTKHTYATYYHWWVVSINISKNGRNRLIFDYLYQDDKPIKETLKTPKITLKMRNRGIIEPIPPTKNTYWPLVSSKIIDEEEPTQSEKTKEEQCADFGFKPRKESFISTKSPSGAQQTEN